MSFTVFRTNSLKVVTRASFRGGGTPASRNGDFSHANPGSLARFITAVYQGMTIQSINGATRKQLFDLAQTSLRAWPVS
jgi:hypothetical protein